MAYETGPASGVTDSIDKLAVFAVAAGWTQNRRDANSLSISKATVFQNVFDASNALHCKASRAYDAGQAWNSQPGADFNVQKAINMAGAFAAYHFFADQNYLHIVVEVDPGDFRHVAFGELAKTSTYTGGEYSCAVGANGIGLFNSNQDGAFPGSYPNIYDTGSVFVTVDGFNDWSHFLLGPFTGEPRLISCDDYYTQGKGFFYDWYTYCSPNTLNGLTALAPIYIMASRPDSKFSPLGVVRDIRLLNIGNYNPGDTVTIGTDDWLVFPYISKTVSGNYGLAYRKVP